VAEPALYLHRVPGAWRTFGFFKNHGDCVSFVATGGKNPPRRKKL